MGIPTPGGYTDSFANGLSTYHKSLACFQCGGFIYHVKNHRCARCFPKYKTQYKNLQEVGEYNKAEGEFIRTMARLRIAPEIAMQGVNYSGDNAYPDEPPYNYTHKPRGYYTGLRMGSSIGDVLNFAQEP